MEHLLLLHGAIGSKDQWQPIIPLLEDRFVLHPINFPGHGNTTLPEADFSIPLFVTSVLHYLNEQQIEKASVFGYSMGGYVAISLAKQFPERINRIITLGTKINWNETEAAKEIAKLQPDIIQAKIPAFAEQLSNRHQAAGWKTVLAQTANLIKDLGNNQYLSNTEWSGFSTPTILMLGDKDKMVTLEETVALQKQLPNAQLAVLPDTPHPIEQVNLSLLVFMIKHFLR